MEIYNEKVHYENPFMFIRIFEATRNKEHLSRWHYHKEIEILVLTEGQLDVHVEDEYYPLKASDVLLIGPSQLHRDRSYANRLTYLVFQFDLEQYMDQSMLPYMHPFTGDHIPLNRLNYLFHEQEELRRTIFSCVLEIYKESRHKENGFEIAVSLLIKKIILSLIRADNQKVLNFNSNPDMLRLKPVLEYIDEHLDEKIQVEEASKLVNFSYFYFIKFFKKVLGMSFTEYVHYKKIKKAERMLLTKDLSIAQIGSAVGMQNMAHFYKIFKKHNQCSPNEYRKKMLEFRSIATE